MNKTKTIRVTCEAAATLPLDKLKPLQGDLKTLPEENYTRLRASILKHGITFPFFVWRSGNDHFIIDAHQRDKVLRRMAEENYEVPPVPVAWISAADQREAREKILLCNSQYGQMTPESLGLFITAADLNIKELDAVSVMPFDLSGIIATPTDEEVPEPKIEEAEKLQKKWKTKLGQLWQLGNHRLMCGDSTKKTAVEILMGGGYSASHGY